MIPIPGNRNRRGGTFPRMLFLVQGLQPLHGPEGVFSNPAIRILLEGIEDGSAFGSVEFLQGFNHQDPHILIGVPGGQDNPPEGAAGFQEGV